MAKYRSGKLPKAFKVIPSLSNWEEVSLKQGSSTLFHFSMPQQGFDPLTPMSDQDRISPHNNCGEIISPQLFPYNITQKSD